MTTAKCAGCPVAGESCAALGGPRWAYLCDKTPTGTLSDLAQIRALSEGAGEEEPEANPALMATPAKKASVSASVPAPAPAPSRTVSVALSKAVLKRGGRRCFYGGPPPCGSCQGLAACHWLGRTVSVRDCTNCLREMS